MTTERKQAGVGLGESSLTAMDGVPLPSFQLPADLQEILQLILTQLEIHVDCDASMLMLIVDETLFVAASRVFSRPAEFEGLCFNLDKVPRLRHMILQDQSILSPEILLTEPFEGATDFIRMRSCVKAPLLYRDRLVGTLILMKEEPDYYSEEEIRLTMSFAVQAAMAIENNRLFEETQRRAMQLETASQVSKRVTAILEIDDLLSEVVRLIMERFGFYHVHLFLVDGRSNEIVLRACSGNVDKLLGTEGLRLKIGGQSITGWVAGTGQFLLCNDVSKEPRYHPHELLPETWSELAIPLQVSDVVLGVLDVQSKRKAAFQEDDITALQILADQTAIAIENAHLFQETRRQYDAMRALHTISLDITSRLENVEAMSVILEKAAYLLKAEGGTLAIYDPEVEQVQIAAVYNAPFEYQGKTVEPGDAVVGKVLLTKKPIIINDYRHWSGPSSIFHASLYNAILSVPLRWHDRVLGVLSVLDNDEQRIFSDEDAQLLSLFADLASISLKNAEFHTAEMEFTHQLEQKVAQRTLELTRAQQALADKAEQLQRLLTTTVNIQEEERARIARDLHDGVNQLITGTLFEIQAAQQSLLATHNDIALQRLEAAKELLRLINSENRNIITGLRPMILDTQGLLPALREYIVSYQKRNQITCTMTIFGQSFRFFHEAETAVYRIIQESLNNVVAHAKASQVNIRIRFKPSGLRIVVEDNGIGFDYKTVESTTRGHMGLVGIRERALSIGGQVEIRTKPGEGVQVVLDIPQLENMPS